MKGVLKKQSDGWVLESDSGKTVDSGGYPLVQDDDFIESAAGKLDNWKYHSKPYNVVDDSEGE